MSTTTTDSMITPVSFTQSSPPFLDSTSSTSPSLPTTESSPSHNDKELEYEQPLSLSFLSLKDQRAHEVDRQRQKQAKDFAQNLSRKARDYSSLPYPRLGWIPQLYVPGFYYQTAKSPGPTVASEMKLGLGMEDPTLVEDWVEQCSGGMSPTREQPRAFGTGKEAKLGDLIVTVRKPRKRQETDFEVIPHVRSVIVLDDIVQTKDVSVVDEPWEHIGDDEKRSGEFTVTYANVVANSGTGAL